MDIPIIGRFFVETLEILNSIANRTKGTKILYFDWSIATLSYR